MVCIDIVGFEALYGEVSMYLFEVTPCVYIDFAIQYIAGQFFSELFSRIPKSTPWQ